MGIQDSFWILFWLLYVFFSCLFEFSPLQLLVSMDLSGWWNSGSVSLLHCWFYLDADHHFLGGCNWDVERFDH